MEIKYLALNNFLTFRGHNRIDFSSGDKMTLCLGVNNSGKTNILRALYYLFYGTTYGLNAKNTKPEDLINYRSFYEQEPNKEVEATLEIQFKHRGQDYILERTISGRCDESRKNKELITTTEQLYWVDARDDYCETSRGNIKDKMASIVPMQLFDFYFFKGEEITKEILEKNNLKNVADAISAVFSESNWKAAVKELDKISKEFEDQFAQAAQHDGQITKYITDKTALEEKLEEREQNIEEKKEICQKARSKYLDLKEKADSNEEREYLQINEKIKSNELALNQAQKDRFEINKEIKDTVNDFGVHILLKKAYAKAFNCIEKLREDAVLPAPAAKEVFTGLLHKGECFCGQPLTPGTSEWKAIEKQRDLHIDLNLSQDLHQLGHELGDANENNYFKLGEKNIIDLKRLRSDDSQLYDKIQELESEKDNLNAKRNANAEGDYLILLQQRDAAEKDYESLKTQLQKLEFERERYIKNIKDIDKKIDDLGIMGESANLRKSSLLAKGLSEEINKDQLNLKKDFRQELQREVSEIYDSIVTDGSKAVIDGNLYPSIHRGGAVNQLSGGGQSQVLILSYIISLSKLRMSVNKRLKKDYSIRGVDDQCYFLDSVFAPMDTSMRSEVAEKLSSRLRQVSLLLSHDQWSKETAPQLEPFVEKCYAIKLHTHKPQRGTDLTKFKGQEYKLVEEISNTENWPDADVPYTEIVQLN